jgi:hypothetical protein
LRIAWDTPLAPPWGGDPLLLGTVTVMIGAFVPDDTFYRVVIAEARGASAAETLYFAGGTEQIRVFEAWYQVGDVCPAGTGVDAGAFGDGVLTNADVRTCWYWSQGAAAPITGNPADGIPPADSDRFDAADSMPEDAMPAPGGDGVLGEEDVLLTFQRSLLPALHLPYERRRRPDNSRESRIGGGILGDGRGSVLPRIQALSRKITPDGVLYLPIELVVPDGLALTTLQFAFQVEGIGNSPWANQVSFEVNPELPPPKYSLDETTLSSVMVGWISDLPTPFTGTVRLGRLAVTPFFAGALGDAWTIHVLRPSGTDGGREQPLDGRDGILEIGEAMAPWSLPVAVTGTAPASLLFGQAVPAGDGFDSCCDLRAVPGNPDGAWFESPAGPLVTSIRALEHEMTWMFQVQATAQPVSISWSLPQEFPAGKYLTLYELDDNGSPVSGSEIDMSRNNALGPLHGDHRFAIRFAGSLRAFIDIRRGWNLAGLWLQPQNSAVEDVFSTAARFGGRGDGRETTPLFSGHVWRWGGRTYKPVHAIQAFAGFWLYALEDGLVASDGLPATELSLVLNKGWNLISPPGRMMLPTDNEAVFHVGYAWDTTTGGYVPCQALLRPGAGYWLGARAPCVIPLPGGSGREFSTR